MKIAPINNSRVSSAKKHDKNNNPSFKAGVLDFTGAFMQGIEKQGYFLSFLIQDGLGMTVPRVITGLYRDKEVTGHYNKQEALEVFGREGMTGPFMMAVAPTLVWLTGKFCHSASSNTRMIKAMGENFKTLIKNNKFSSAVKNDKNSFINEFYKQIWEKVYKDSIPNDKNSKEAIEYILSEFKKYTKASSFRERDKLIANIENKVNERLLHSSSKLDGLCKLSIEANGKTNTFSVKDMILGIRNFGVDSIERNKNYKDIDAKAIENITNNFATKRLMFNIAGVATTLGGLSILPKIYAHNSVAPGAAHLVKEKEEMANAKKSETDNNQNLSFKGKGINSDGILSKIGKFLHNKIPDFLKKEFEYNGINFTYTLMASLSLFGLLLPRSIRAYNRAYIDENGKRDLSEINEILLRDSISSLSVVFTVPILQKLFVSLLEKNKGFVLTNKASNKWYDKINPYSKLQLLSNSELQAIYGNIDSKAKMLNFANFINDKGGDLQKILSKSNFAKDVFNSKSFTLESLSSEFAALEKNAAITAKNKKIISFFEKLEDNNATKDLITKLMNDAGKGKKGSIVKRARGFNSIPGFLTTVVISPIILGILIPMLTYSNTRKTHAKMKAANSQN